MNTIPARVQHIINTIAAKHEVSPDDIIGRASTRAVEQARQECYRAVLDAPKPNGQRPTRAEVARWFSRGHKAISDATRENA